MKNLPFIRGHKVYIGPMPNTIEFFEIYKSWLNLERVKFGTGDVHDYSTADVVKILKKWEDDPQNMTFCVYDLKSGQPIGDVCIRYGYEEYDNDGPETAIMIGKNYGQGSGFEAMLLLLRYGFQEFNYDQINLHVYENNTPAVRLFEKLGFKKIGSHVDKTNERSEYIMAITRGEFLAMSKEYSFSIKKHL